MCFFQESVKISEITAFYDNIFVYFSPALRLKKSRQSDIINTIYLQPDSRPEISGKP